MDRQYTKLTRSELMSRVRGKGNKTTELRLIGIFRDMKIRGWRRNMKLVGRPDFVFPSIKAVIFVDGCFWHGCPKHFKQPSSNAAYWSTKIANNRTRDRKVARILRSTGWKVIRIWEHSLTQANRPKLLTQLKLVIQI